MKERIEHSTTDKKISIVIPAKNESASIGKLITKILSLQYVSEVIVVDDGSTDKTGDVAAEAGAKVIFHPYCKGNGAAIKTGASCASGEAIIFMDADGQHDVDDIPRFIDLYSQGFALIVGARSSVSQASFGRLVANSLYNRLASFIVGHKVEDLTSGFRMANAQKFRKFLHLLPNGFSYPTTSTMAFFRAGYSVCYVPIVASKRVGKSHINLAKDGIRFLLIIFKVATLYSPLKVFLPISVSFFLSGFLYYMYTLFAVGRFTNMSALFLSTSILIFLIGLVSEQITTLIYKDSE